MKQKYILSRDIEKEVLTIREFSELSKDSFTLVCEEDYGLEKIEKAIAEGKDSLIKTLRTPNFYPVAVYIGQIADAVISLFEEKGTAGEPEPRELLFDDVDLFVDETEAEEAEAEEEVEIEDLLDSPEEGADKLDKDELDKTDEPQSGKPSKST